MTQTPPRKDTNVPQEPDPEESAANLVSRVESLTAELKTLVLSQDSIKRSNSRWRKVVGSLIAADKPAACESTYPLFGR
jgi:hypothetical protein